MDRRIVVESLNTPEEEGSVVFHSPKVCQSLIFNTTRQQTEDWQTQNKKKKRDGTLVSRAYTALLVRKEHLIIVISKNGSISR